MFDLKDLDVQSPLAGALGGVVRSLALRLTFPESASSVVVGGICAAYLSPLVYQLFGGTFGVGGDGTSGPLAGFVIGLGGMAASGFVMDLWKGLRKRQQKDDSKDGPSS